MGISNQLISTDTDLSWLLGHGILEESGEGTTEGLPMFRKEAGETGKGTGGGHAVRL